MYSGYDIKIFRWECALNLKMKSMEKNWFSSSTYPLQNIIMSVCVCAICVWIRSVLDSWLKRLEDNFFSSFFIYFIFLLYKFVLLSLLYVFIKRMFQVHNENKLCHKIFYGHSFFLLFIHIRERIRRKRETWKNIAFVSGKIYWHTFCRFLCQNCLYSNAINHGNLFWEMYNFMCFFGSVNKFSFVVKLCYVGQKLFAFVCVCL